MDGTAVIASMIFLCVGILMVMVFSEPLKVIGRVLLGAILGMVGIYAVNMMRSEEHTSELQSQFRISYAVFCLKK